VEAIPIDLCLLVPPFAQVETPTLGVAILAAACRAQKLTVKVVHANLMLAARTGHPAYRTIANSNVASMLGERLFLPHAYRPDRQALFDPPAPLSARLQASHDLIAPAVAPLLDDVCDRILALRPRILGISSSYQQTLAASAIAHRVKAAAPHIRIVLGGPNASSPMGEALAEIFPWIDHFFSGEADIAFPDFCATLLKNGAGDLPRVIHCPPLVDMRGSPTPDFGDYFADLRALSEALPATLPEALPVETSRGCWWGAKNHCTFCGLNGATMMFREKPAATALAELDALEADWGVGRFAVADNIMPLRYLTELLPSLAARARAPSLFYEVKANLKYDELALMARAGIDTIQPGIESLASPVLKLMRKGVSAHQNIALLRDCRTLGIRVVWNYLYGFPGEAAEHYGAVAPLIPALEHLEPPNDFSPLIVDRFSPYHSTPAAFGIDGIEPIAGYRGLFPRHARLDSIAYHFKGRYTTALLDDPDTRLAISRAIGAWRLQWITRDQPELRIAIEEGAPVLIDTRRIATAARTPLPPAWDHALRLLERPHAPGNVGAEAGVIDALMERRYVIAHEGLLLSLVTREATTEATEVLAYVKQSAA
jgi:ribosomal peptide maturation radical SAM protein 1